MKTKFFLIPLILLSLVVLLLFAFRSPVQASILDSIKALLSIDNKNVKSMEFTIDSQIELVPEGDENKDGQIDAGDIIRFTYTITNTTDKSYTYATLKTNIDRKQLNFVHNVYGVTGLTDNDDTIIFRNLRINPQEQHTISFDARINYYQEDKGITSEPEFITSDNKSVIKAARKDVNAKKLTKEEVRERLSKNGIIFNREQE